MRLSLSYNQDHFLQITHPVQERLATSPVSFSSTLFEQWCGFVSHRQDRHELHIIVILHRVAASSACANESKFPEELSTATGS